MHNAHKKLLMMGRGKELYQDLRNKIVEQHKNETGYQLISKLLNVPQCSHWGYYLQVEEASLHHQPAHELLAKFLTGQ